MDTTTVIETRPGPGVAAAHPISAAPPPRAGGGGRPAGHPGLWLCRLGRQPGPLQRVLELPDRLPLPTTCVQVTGTPDPLGTPGPRRKPQCSEPLETATPYGRQILSQGHQASLNIFHHDQNVRWGSFRLTYTGKTAGAVLTTGLQV